ncbi:MAG: hypothetical protein HYX72_00820 [Acidobacteria bacterium]|nr:hypothetical protein [Acidobacteriota bacterium]
MKTFADFQQGVAERIQDAAGKLSSAAIDGCIREALAGRYSVTRPLRKVAELTGNGLSYQWEIDSENFPGWSQNFSVISEVEYPAGDRDPAILEKDEWQVYWGANGVPQLRLTTIVPGTGKIVRVRYTAPHAEDASDFPDADFYGAVNLAAALAAWRLHALYNQLGDAALGADAVDYRGKAAEYRALARALETAFEAAFGIDRAEEQPAASSVAEWRINSESGGRRITH